MEKIKIEDLGEVGYQDAYQYQKQLVQEVHQGAAERILICSHHPIVTLGRQSKAEDLQGWKGSTIKIERGGRATYHGPGQIIIYPIINLKRRNNDIHRYVRSLEDSVIKTLKQWDIIAVGNPDGTAKTTGVWIKNKKIASIGIAVKHWITYHGIALNVLKDPLAFTGINPCGFSTNIMTSLEEYLDHSIDYQQVKKLFLQNTIENLRLDRVDTAV